MSFIDLFALIGAVDYAFSIPATLTRRDGTTYNFDVCTERAADPSRATDYGATPYAVSVRAWSVNPADLEDFKGKFIKPQSGDILTITDEQGAIKRYAVTVDDTSGALGRWKHNRPGVRWIFYTKNTEELEL